MTPDERLAELEAETTALRERVQLLAAPVRDRPGLREPVELLAGPVQDLEARLAKDRPNSGKPPSSDGLKRKPKSLRQRRGKKAGGQLGHRGQTLQLVATPDAVVEHRPAVCAGCHRERPHDAFVVLRERRQGQDLPPVRLVVTEHQALRRALPHLPSRHHWDRSPEAPSRAHYGPRLRALAVYLVQAPCIPLGRVQQRVADLVGVRLGRGTLVTWTQQAARTLEPVEQQRTVAVQRAAVRHNDATGVRRAGQLAWAPVACTDRLTPDTIHAQRGRAATDAIGILPAFTGVSVHDGFASYRM